MPLSQINIIYHCSSCRITLYVDDIYIGERQLPTDTIDVTQLYLGGVLLTTSQDLAPNFEGLYGCINDVVINGE